jgi:hypothetical protein
LQVVGDGEVDPPDAPPAPRELSAARDALAQGRRDEDTRWLGRTADYAAGGYVRDKALFLTRAADAHLALGQI